MKQGTHATKKNSEADDLLLDSDGKECVLWDEGGGHTGGMTLIRYFDADGNFLVQTPVKLDKEEFTHTGRTWVKPPPAMPNPTKEEHYRMVRSGWLSPDGKLYACSYAQHTHLSYVLCYHFKLREKVEEDHRNYGNDNERALEEHGWMKLSEFGGGLHWFGRQDDKPMTQKQRDAVLLWKTAHGEDAKNVNYELDMDEDEEGFSLL